PGIEPTRITHGTTVATNAILEGRGARTALITTKGFRDVLELARLRRPSLFDADYLKPRPLVPRDLRFEVDERIDSSGQILRPLLSEDLAVVVDKVRDSGAQAVAICLLNSYVN